MLVLSLDTTTRAGSAAVVDEHGVRGQLNGDPSQTHGARLPLDLMRTLDTASVTLAEIDLLAVAAGPGSFTGIRVGISAMQGLAMATGKRIVPVSALDALARAGEADGSLVAAWMDAQRGEVFAALYDPPERRVLIEASSLSPQSTLDGWGRTVAGRAIRFIGDGAVRYEAVVRDRLGPGIEIVGAPPLAGVIGRLAAQSPERALGPHAIVPIYIRRPDAELARIRHDG